MDSTIAGTMNAPSYVTTCYEGFFVRYIYILSDGRDLKNYLKDFQNDLRDSYNNLRHSYYNRRDSYYN